MSYHDAGHADCSDTQGAIQRVIRPSKKDLGEFSVRRALPAAQQRMVGPFIFFDHMGPAEFPPGKGIAVRPHPHIGIATITYLFEGEILHRDSLGYVQPIRSGAVNLMTAGSGIVHSERAGEDLEATSRLHGIQSWIALPEDAQETTPTFEHYPADAIPAVVVNSVSVRIIVGSAFGHQSPVRTYSPTLYLECRLPAGASLTLPNEHEELAAYLVDGNTLIGDQSCEPGTMAVACAGQPITVHAATDSLLMIIGGASIGARHIWWNFVSSSRARIEQAKDDWQQGRFDPVNGDPEFIPLPE